MILRLERLQDGSARSHHVVDLAGADDHADRGRHGSSPLARWVATAVVAHEPCLVLDRDGRVLGMSGSASELLGCASGTVIGRPLLDVIDLVDFDTGVSSPDYAARIAPLAVLAADSGLMRSLLRVRHRDGGRVTVDASAAPIRDAQGNPLGSFTFLAELRG
jgi:PAS domain S-box-containing protein